MANKAMNDTCSPKVLVLSLLFFDVVPRMPFGGSSIPEQNERMPAVMIGRAEMETIVAQQRTNIALGRKHLPTTISTITARTMVLLYREREKQWVGPGEGELMESKTVYVRE